MENEEEDVSKLPNPPHVQLQHQHDDSTNLTVTAMVMAVGDSRHDDDEVRRGSNAQCHLDSAAEVTEALTATAASEGRYLEEEKEGDEVSIRGGTEAGAELGGEEDVSRESRQFVSVVAATRENGVAVNSGDAGVVAAVVGAGCGKEDLIYKEGSQGGETGGRADVAEEMKEKVKAVEEMKEKVEAVGDERLIRADVADEMDRKVVVAEEAEINADLTEDREIRAEVAEEMEERFGVGEETGIMANVTEETEIRAERGKETEERFDVTDGAKGADLAGETEIADEITAEVTENHCTNGEMLERIAIQDEEPKADVRQETEEKSEMVEKMELQEEMATAEVVSEETGMPEQMAIAEDTVVATAAEEMEVGDGVAEEKEMQEETEVTDDVAGVETGLGEETVMQEENEVEAEAEADMEMDDVLEEADTDVADETEKADMAEEKEGEESEEVAKTVGGKRKRGGKNSKPPGRVAPRKKSEEDVCFICFDGGELVLCDRRGCPKAYHPACVNRDEAFFRAKGRWNCGVVYSTANLAVVDLCEGTGSKTFSFAQHNVQVLQAHQVG